MILRFNILSPNSTGSPDYNICSQGASVISNVNLGVTLKLNGVSFFTTADLSTAVIPATPILVGGRTIDSFNYGVNGFYIRFQNIAQVNIQDLFEIQLSKVGYQSYNNIFKVYNYDLGNSGLVTTNNPDFDFYLINNTNNLVSGIQTKVFSKFTIIKKPFTNQFHYYNLVGTQGTIRYSNITNPLSITPLFTGQNGFVVSSTGLSISQKIAVYDIYSNLVQLCQTNKIVTPLIWLPIINSIASNTPSCSDTCINNIGVGNYEVYIDLANLTCIYINDVAYYPYFGGNQASIISTVYDYQGFQLSTSETAITINICGSVCPQSPIVTPLPVLPEVGDIVIKTRFVVKQAGILETDPILTLIDCSKTTIIPTCNWFKIEPTDNCGEYIVTNCSVDTVSLTIDQLQEDKTLLTISTVVFKPLTSVTITLQEEGVYTINVPSKINNQIQSYVIINDCLFKECLFKYLKMLICSKKEDSCSDNIKDYYDFNSFIMNAHSYFALVNEQYNFNYIYTSYSDKDISNLYTIKQYLDNLKAYCKDDCLPCGCSEL